jgi:integrase
MSIKKCPITGLWRADFRASGRRFRETFESREDARQYFIQTRLTAKLGVSVAGEIGKPLDESISEYCSIETIKKETAQDEKAFLREFYRYIVNIENLTGIGQIKLIHLNRYQQFLQDEKARSELWEKVELARQQEAQAGGRKFKPSKRPRKALSGSSVNRHMNSIADLFKWAKRWDWIKVNPTAELEPTTERPIARLPWPTNESIQAAINMASMWAKPAFYLIAQTGIRPVGAKRLTWDDVDMSGRKFKIISKKGRDGKLRETTMMMTNEVFEFFKWLWQRRHVGKNGQFVFHSASGLQLDTKSLAREMAKITNQLQLKGYSLYGFRHSMGTAATNPSLDGTRSGNIEIARQILGHASIEQTKHYNKTGDEILRNQMEEISRERNIKFKGEE